MNVKKLLGLIVFAATALAMSACASLPNGLPSVNDEGQSPRTTTVLAADNVIEVMDALTDAEITAFLANRVALEALSGMAARRTGLSHDPAGPLLEGR